MLLELEVEEWHIVFSDDFFCNRSIFVKLQCYIWVPSQNNIQVCSSIIIEKARFDRLSKVNRNDALGLEKGAPLHFKYRNTQKNVLYKG